MTAPGLIREMQRAMREADRALNDYLADLPDPADTAAALPLDIAEMLTSAAHVRQGIRAADERVARLLRPYGLCEVRGLMLTNFGTAVRRAVIRDMAL